MKNGDSYLHTEANKDTDPDPLTGNIKFYGGCNLSQVTGNSSVVVNHGTFDGAVFGGGKGVSGFAEYGNIGGNASVLIKAGFTKGADVYGGCALGNVSGNTTVDLAGGAVHDVYGGGLGDASTAALVKGDALITLNGSTEDGATNDCQVYGSIFGCNNVNGTPRGHAKVHVLKTIRREGQAEGEYHVAAVYGGGNHAAYQPTSNDENTEVLIENCDNSIEYVYGGGNAAPVPATNVTIYGANAINHAFAGGNGKTAEGQPQNPGADVGYLGYHSSGNATVYGSGIAKIYVFGGTVHNVYGGSNTLGYIRKESSVNVKNAPDDYKGSLCKLDVGNVFGGGNEADIDGNVVMNLDCSEGGSVLYAGANKANVNGNITLNIYSGTFEKVFCGNNESGKIFGSLKINVDETGCWPVMIGELYGGGNLAPYSVYGYDDGGNILTEGTAKYQDPEINLISFTYIGKVFGGGFGESAKLYGNTHVNVEPIKGIFAGTQVQPKFILNDQNERVANTEFIDIPDEAGTIGSIYGGGNAGAVYGNTEVKIGTLTTNHHISGADTTTEKDVAVTITGNVFGGGNEAIVSGNTNVIIGETL